MKSPLKYTDYFRNITVNKRTIIIGDVHGCLHELNELLNKVAFEQDTDRLIFVGDAISKGPFEYETLLKIRSLRAEVVMGNHELAFLKYLKEKKMLNPTFEKLKNKLLSKLPEWQAWFKSLPLYIETDGFIVVHAGLHPNKKPHETDTGILTSIRTWDPTEEKSSTPEKLPWFYYYKGSKLVIFGHWAKQGLVVRSNVIGLDTGCVYGKKLSALILPEKKIVQVQAKHQYQQIKRPNQ